MTRLILDDAEIARILKRMAFEILERHNDAEKLALVGVHTRGVHIAKRLKAAVEEAAGVALPLGTLDISLYRDDWTKIARQPVLKGTDIAFPLEGLDILLVDDVLYTGRTTRAAMDALMDFGRPDRIRLAVLVDRGHRELPIHADFVGKSVETRRTETVNVMMEEADGQDSVTIEEA